MTMEQLMRKLQSKFCYYRVNLIISFIFLNIAMHAQSVKIPQIEFSPKGYVCYRTDKQLKIDGILDEPVWEKAEWISDFTDIKGISSAIPKLNTKVKMLWDEKYLYVAAKMEEPNIWATLKKHDDIIWHDNAFEIFIDPDGSTHKYCEIEINAFNTIWDLLLLKPYRDMKKPNISGWDIKGLKSAVSINGTLNKPDSNNKNWTVEFAIPWQALQEITEVAVPPKNFDQWRVNFLRVEWKTEVKGDSLRKAINPSTKKAYPPDYWAWSPQGIVDMHYPEMWGYIQFSENLVGTSKVSFAVKKEENAKWFLRNIYYAEKNYFAKYGRFTNDLDELKVRTQNIPGYKLLPLIEVTSDMFEAAIQSEDGQETIKIRNDGFVWIVQTAK
jgi:hypothetical protein